MREVVDRIIGNKAVLVSKGGRSRIVPKSKLKVGDVLVGGKVSGKETNKTKRKIRELLGQVFRHTKTRRSGSKI